MGDQSIWRTEPDGVLAAESDGLRLVVQGSCRVGGAVRFLAGKIREVMSEARNCAGSLAA